MSDLKLASNFEQKTKQDWLEQVDKVLRGADFERKLVKKTYDDIRIDPLYSVTAKDDASAPGSAPYTRGWQAKTDGTWGLNQRHIASDPEDVNTAILEDLEGGTSSLTITLAAPGQAGLPFDGDAVRKALGGVRLDMIALSIDAGSRFGELPDLIKAITDNRPDETGDTRVSVLADPLGTLARLGALDSSMDENLAQLVSLAKAKTDGLKLDKIISVSGHPYHNAGASDAEELAAMLATLVAYMRALEQAGISPADAISMMAVTLAADAELFNTVAKFRAARRLITQIADACGCPDAARDVTLKAQTSERMMTRLDPWVNMLRTTAACTGAALGGAQEITVLPFTWSLGQPDKFARRMARNCQIVLMEEAALGTVIDPTGGSAYADYLTDQLAQKSWEIFQKTEKSGGMFKALQSGIIQSAIAETHQARAKNVALGKAEITGVSSFPNLKEAPVKVTPHQMPAAIEDEAITVEPLPMRRESEPFELLRDAADAYATKNGDLPALFLANLGVLTDFNARANWASSFFSTGGLQAITNPGFKDHDALIEAFKNSPSNIACICSSDPIYLAEAEDIARKLKSAGAAYVYLAGRAGEKRDDYQAAGIDSFIHMGVNILDTLKDAHDRMEVS